MFKSRASRGGPKTQTPTSGMALLLKALSHLGDVPEHLLDGGELVHLDWSPEEELEDESEETTASLVGEKVVSGKV